VNAGSGGSDAADAAEAAEAAFSIRSATPADEAALVDLGHSSAIHHASIDPKRWRVPTLAEEQTARRYWHAARPRDEGLVAVAGEVVVGVIELWLKRPRGPAGAHVQSVSVDFGLAVLPEWRGRGVGSALLEAAETWARAQGAERMSMDLSSANAGALRLYERMGYEVHALEMDKVIEPDPAKVEDLAVIRNLDGEPVPTLRGESVVLRPLRPDDRDALLGVLRDPSVVAVWDTRGPENSVAELYAGDKGWTVWVIEVDGEFAGSIQASEEEDGDYDQAGIDIFMSSGFQGRGLGTDAVRTLARYLIEVRGHHRLTIDPAADNARAIATYAKVGFKPVGVMRAYERGSDGTYHDGLLMDMLAHELR
jgi:aminoglycoside 6'-N-acetyltransferase